MKVRLVPVLSDNYAYLLIDEKQKIAAAVDPAESQKVMEAAKEEGVSIAAVLTTHHHWDHSSGNASLKAALPEIAVYGHDERIDTLTHRVNGGDTFSIGNLKVTVHFTPCHTKGHVLYQVEGEAGPAVVFTGDTLFVGTGKEMHLALSGVIASLPPTTQLFCGHEYTVKNLEFAASLFDLSQQSEPFYQAVKAKLQWAKQQRSQGLPTIPSTVEEEKQYNPFLRVTDPSLCHSLGLPPSTPPEEVMQVLRERKDNF